MRIVVCSAEWATGMRRNILNEMIFDLNPDIVCATEVRKDFFKEPANVIYSESDYGYNTDGRYKVSLWSKKQWSNIKQSLEYAPQGRFLSASTDIDGKSIGIVGVCILWKSAHVSTGNKNRKLWEGHLSYISGLERFLQGRTDDFQIICGDMNQRIPKTMQPDNVYEKLQSMLSEYTIITSGVVPRINKQVIDHIAIRGLETRDIYGIPRFKDGIELTDHDIIFAEIFKNK